MGKKSVAVQDRTRTLKIILPLLILLCIGLVMVYDASVAEAERIFGDRYYFITRHALWISVGLVGMFLSSRLPTALVRKSSHLIFIGTLVLLLLVLIPGLGTSSAGAQRWIRLAPSVSFQPSEFAKLATVLYLSSWLQRKPRILHFFVLITFLLGVLTLQPDLGTAVILTGTAFLMLFVSGASLRVILPGAVLGLVAVFLIIVSSDYRKQRVLTFLDPTREIRGASYHINQVLISLGSGGWFGLGLGRSRQKFQYLPEASTDSIFAVIGEELGFIGSVGLLLIFCFLYYQLFKIVLREPNEYRRLLAVGLGGWLVIQTTINIGAMAAVFPLTGVPLPFISYGGSSLISQLLSMGILLRISLTQR